MLARQGGDEFLLLLGSGGDEDPRRAAQTAGERIAAALDEPFEISDALFHVGASIGVALYPEHAADADTLFKHADHAMYQAKRRGGGTVAFYEAEATDARERLSLTSRLRRAIREGELRLHVQPIVDVQDSRIVAVEALVRWQDPEHGLIPPAMFIGVAEETGLIDGIGDWVLEALCAHGALWRDAGLRAAAHVQRLAAPAAASRSRRVDPRAHRALRPRARPLLRGADGERDPQRRARAPHDALGPRRRRPGPRHRRLRRRPLLARTPPRPARPDAQGRPLLPRARAGRSRLVGDRRRRAHAGHGARDDDGRRGRRGARAARVPAPPRRDAGPGLPPRAPGPGRGAACRSPAEASQEP